MNSSRSSLTKAEKCRIFHFFGIIPKNLEKKYFVLFISVVFSVLPDPKFVKRPKYIFVAGNLMTNWQLFYKLRSNSVVFLCLFLTRYIKKRSKCLLALSSVKSSKFYICSFFVNVLSIYILFVSKILSDF